MIFKGDIILIWYVYDTYVDRHICIFTRCEGSDEEQVIKAKNELLRYLKELRSHALLNDYRTLESLLSKELLDLGGNIDLVNDKRIQKWFFGFIENAYNIVNNTLPVKIVTSDERMGILLFGDESEKNF